MFLFLALFILAATRSMCKGQHENNCKVVPKDPYIEVGSDTEIVCQTSCVSGKIFWTLNSGRIDESQSSAVNSSHTVLTLRNFTLQSATLECRSANTHLVLGGTTIQTYSKPSNISCILDHKDQSSDEELSLEPSPDWFTCNWQHQIDSKQKINYTVLYDSPYTHHAEICTSQITNCITIEPSAKMEYFSNFTITVRAEADTWKADSDPREFKPLHILKMARPQLRVTPSSDHVFVQWSRSSFSSKCGCEVKYSKAVDKGAPAVLRRKNLSERSYGEDTIEKWDSCSNYTFSVRCALNKAPWSNWSKNKTVLTKLNKRDFKLRLWRKVAEPEGNGVRKVHAMWTEIPSTCQDTFTYTIKVTPYKDAMVGVNYTDTSCGSSTCDVYVNQDAHRMRLTVLHNETLLVEDSVCVPAVGESESLPQVTDIQTSTLEGVLLVSWKASTEPVTGYMIDWTHDGNQYYWKESNCTNTTLPDHKQPYNITVTPLFDDETGHGTQALQICSRVGDPGDVTIQVQADAKSALVSWNVKSQEACSGVVVNYTVFYGIQNGPQLNVPVDGTEQFISLNNLNPDTYYSVQVNATALTGTATSRETFFQTKRFDAQLITAVGVCGSIVILLVLSLGVCCAVRWNKFREKPVPNPAFSSLALWPAPSPQEGTCPFQPFNNPTESVCDRVYTGESQRTPTSPLATGCDGIPACDQTGEYVDPATGPALVDPVEPVETQHLSSPDDSTALLPSENSPYRSQSSAENSASKFNKQCKRAPLKQIEKIAPVTVYVTLDMLQQGQGR